MYASTFAHLSTNSRPAGYAHVAPARRKDRRRSATLPTWRNHTSLLRARTSQR